MNPFDYINSITYSKVNMMAGTENDELAEKSYPAYLVNKGLSYFPDTILYANEMNQYSFVDNKLQYSYLINSIRPLKRFAKWAKKEDSNDLDAVKEYYGYSNEKASQALSLLSVEQLDTIKEQLQKGGLNEPSRKSGRGKTKERG
jgi:hypothetical protein